MTTRLMPLMLVAAVLACASSCAKPDWIQQTLVTVDVTGNWVNADNGPPFKLQLEQQGAKVTGSMERWVLPMGSITSTQIEGNVSGDVFRFQTRGLLSCVGEFTVSGDDMRGSMDCGRTGHTRLLQRRDSSRPASQP